MIRKTFVFCCMVVVALAWSASVVSAQSQGYLRISGAHTIQVSASDTPRISVEFGARRDTLNDVAIVCTISPLPTDPLAPDAIRLDIFDEAKGPFSIANNRYGVDVVFGSYREPPTLDIPAGQAYSVSFNIRLLNVPAGFKGKFGSVQCTLSADVFATNIASDEVVVKVH